MRGATHVTSTPPRPTLTPPPRLHQPLRRFRGQEPPGAEPGTPAEGRVRGELLRVLRVLRGDDSLGELRSSAADSERSGEN